MSEGVVVWITGRPASGKSTLGARLAERLRSDGTPCAVLDGDEIRVALGHPAGRGPEERDAFYAVLARLAALLARQDLAVIVSATAHRRAYRERARTIAPRFMEIHVARLSFGGFAATRRQALASPNRPQPERAGAGQSAARHGSRALLTDRSSTVAPTQDGGP